jgi:hypothetical protein
MAINNPCVLAVSDTLPASARDMARAIRVFATLADADENFRAALLDRRKEYDMWLQVSATDRHCHFMKH